MPSKPTEPPPPDDAQEAPTRPEMLVACPRCLGTGMVFTCIEEGEDGTLEHAAAAGCTTCGDGTKPGPGQMTAAQLARIEGRPR
jgi:hypothetical protein